MRVTVSLAKFPFEVWLTRTPVTRTMPVGNGGKFTPDAKAIYELVLEMQKASLLNSTPRIFV